jgi:hypothetical protein
MFHLRRRAHVLRGASVGIEGGCGGGNEKEIKNAGVSTGLVSDRFSGQGNVVVPYDVEN